ncbi:EboA domain-containing protein [Shewanella surugensis]|uniref:EboA domain-containing protein n=1 Tax=Shewanella surugensis TaxID=212020 RepID=A0ABT0LGR7_9GAMM|nr:EboA domain-containing protein [Shewanella surugensis]MCL1126898.1 EboA domain-containing protein [Shewanella surugensis]
MRLNEALISRQVAWLLKWLEEPILKWFESALHQLSLGGERQVSIDKLAIEWANLSAQAGRQCADIEASVVFVSLFDRSLSITELIRQQLLCHTLLLLDVSLRYRLFKLCLRYADDSEKQALVKGLDFLDMEGVCQPVIVDLCRTNNTELFASIALFNAWPAKHFSDVEFEQMLLKALFSHFNITSILGLKQRHTQRLSQLTFDYLSERALAARDWPMSIYSAIERRHLTREQIERLVCLPPQVQASLSLH